MKFQRLVRDSILYLNDYVSFNSNYLLLILLFYIFIFALLFLYNLNYISKIISQQNGNKLPIINGIFLIKPDLSL